MSHLAQELEVALCAVRQAAVLCQQVRARLTDSGQATKDDRSPVTIADYGAQALVLHRLAQAFPEVPVVAEEDAADLRGEDAATLRAGVVEAVTQVDASLDEATILAAIDRGNYAGGAQGRFWTLDPIDGTKGFLRNDQYAIALALIEDGKVVLGVLGCPALPVGAEAGASTGCFLSAVVGQGTVLHNAAGKALGPVKVSTVKGLAEASFCESVESGHSRHDWAEAVAQALGIEKPSVRMDSQCKYAAIARGDAEIYLRLPTRPGYQEKIWDHAAGVICVTEAGGSVTDIEGRHLDFSRGRTLSRNQGVIATNAAFHGSVTAAVQQHRS